jgi:hypothetical protein
MNAAQPRPGRGRWVLAGFLGPLAIVGAGLFWLAGVVPECVTEVRGEFPSPDQRLIASIIDLGCGTGETRTRIALRRLTDPFDPDALTTLWLAPGTHAAQIAWTGPDSLVLTVPPSAEATEQADEALGVAVSLN